MCANYAPTLAAASHSFPALPTPSLNLRRTNKWAREASKNVVIDAYCTYDVCNLQVITDIKK